MLNAHIIFVTILRLTMLMLLSSYLLRPLFLGLTLLFSFELLADEIPGCNPPELVHAYEVEDSFILFSWDTTATATQQYELRWGASDQAEDTWSNSMSTTKQLSLDLSSGAYIGNYSFKLRTVCISTDTLYSPWVNWTIDTESSDPEVYDPACDTGLDVSAYCDIWDYSAIRECTKKTMLSVCSRIGSYEDNGHYKWVIEDSIYSVEQAYLTSFDKVTYDVGLTINNDDFRSNYNLLSFDADLDSAVLLQNGTIDSISIQDYSEEDTYHIDWRNLHLRKRCGETVFSYDFEAKNINENGISQRSFINSENGCLTFDGNSDYVTTTSNLMDPIVSSQEFTIEAWINGQEAGQTTFPMILSNRFPDVALRFGMFFALGPSGNGAPKQLFVQFNAQNLVAGNPNIYNVLDGVDHHIAVTKEADSLKFYVDGIKVAQRSAGGQPIRASTTPATLGYDQKTNNHFEGAISDVRVWSTPRTEQEIQETLYGLDPTEHPTLIARFRLNEGAGQTVYDQKLNNNGYLGSTTGVDNNDPTWGAQCFQENECDNPPSFLVTVDTPSCYGALDGGIMLSDSGARYLYSIDAGLTYQDSSTFANLDTGTYTIVVLDTIIGCPLFRDTITLFDDLVDCPICTCGFGLQDGICTALQISYDTCVRPKLLAIAEDLSFELIEGGIQVCTEDALSTDEIDLLHTYWSQNLYVTYDVPLLNALGQEYIARVSPQIGVDLVTDSLCFLIPIDQEIYPVLGSEFHIIYEATHRNDDDDIELVVLDTIRSLNPVFDADCENGIDDDGDGLTDCEDDDCLPTYTYNITQPSCPSLDDGVIEIYVTSVDDDGTSCSDTVVFNALIPGSYMYEIISKSGCITTTEAIVIPINDCQEICDNGIDDDGDGLIDLNDDDCDNFGLVGKYMFTNGSLVDDQGGNDGILSNINPIYDRFCETGNALQFGSTSVMSLGDGYDYISQEDNRFGFSFWFKLDELSGLNDILIAKYGFPGCSVNSNQREFFIRINANNRVEFLWYGELNTSSFRGVEGDVEILDNCWHHAVVNYKGDVDSNDGLDRVEIILDGVVNRNAFTFTQGPLGDIKNGIAHLGIGGPLNEFGNNCSLAFEGAMDDVRLYDRNLLFDEAFTFYTEGTSGDIMPPNYFCESCLTQEICNNGVDDDGDGLTDCEDNDCLPKYTFSITEPSCPELNDGVIELYISSIDENGIGCSDTVVVDSLMPGAYSYEIFSKSGCVTSTELITLSENPCVEICDNDMDDDGDGLTDCEDDDCLPTYTFSITEPTCPELNNGVLELYVLSIDENGASCSDTIVFESLSPGSLVYDITSKGGCVTSTELITIPTIACQEICDNGIDDDGDGLTDCEDDDCQPSIDSIIIVPPSCPTLNDGEIKILVSNSLYTGTDTICQVTEDTIVISDVVPGDYVFNINNEAGCTIPTDTIKVEGEFCIEICGNGLDDDLDGMVDCLDSDCASFDQDGDGICDADDSCPMLPNDLIGQPCDDGDPCTVGDEYGADCNCIPGIETDSDNDGICDVLDPCDNNLAGTACATDPCLEGQIYDTNCNCTGGTIIDIDTDGIADCVDDCILKIISSVVNNPTCPTAPNGSIEIDATPEVGITYEWSTGATTRGIGNLDEGEYTVTLTGGESCSLVQTFIVEAAPDVIMVTDAMTYTSCNETPVDVSVDVSNAIGAYELSLINPNGNLADRVNIDIVDNSINTFVLEITRVISGTYTIELKSSGCLVNSSTIEVEVIYPSTTTLSLNNCTLETDVTTCSNQLFNWFKDGVSISSDVGELDVIEAGEYYVEVSCGGCDASISNTITFTGCVEICDNGIDDDGDGLTDCEDDDCQPSYSFESTPPTCPSQADGTITLMVTSLDENMMEVTNTVSYTDLISGTYQYDIFGINGCAILTAPIEIPFTSCPELCNNGIDDDGDGLTDCEDDDCKPVINEVTMLAPPCPGQNEGEIRIIFSTPEYSIGEDPETCETISDTVIIKKVRPGKQLFLLTDAFGCQIMTDTITIDSLICVEICGNGIDDDGNGLTDCDDLVCGLQETSAPMTTNATCLDANSGSITLNYTVAEASAGPLTYSIDNGGSFSGTPLFENLSAGTYNCIVRNANGCTAEFNVTVSADPSPQITSVTSEDATCPDNNNGSITINAVGATQYSIDGGATYETSGTFIELDAGTYVIMVMNAEGCTATSASVTISDEPTVSITSVTSEDATCPDNNNGTITISAVGATQYSIDGGATYEASGAFTDLSAGIFAIMVMNVEGCTATSASVTINDEPTVSITSVSSEDATCPDNNNGSITISAVGVTQYSIDGGATYETSGTFIELDAGTYAIMVMNAEGCTATSASVTISDEPTVSITSVTSEDATCPDNNNGTITISAVGATQYSIDGGATYEASDAFTDLSAGIYAIMVMNVEGCTATSASVTINDEPTVSITSVSSEDATCPDNNNGSITINAVGATQYSIDGGATYEASGAFTDLDAGTYAIMVMNAEGCTATSTSVTISAEPTVSITNLVFSNSACPTNDNGQISIIAIGATQYSIDGGASFQSSGLFANLTPGTYPVIAQNSEGCTDTGTAIIEGDICIEICDNGIDDDNNGLIDCEDPACDSDGDGVCDDDDLCPGGDDGIDSDDDGIPDGCDTDCQVVLLEEQFSNTTGDFTFIPGVLTSAQGFEASTIGNNGLTLILESTAGGTITNISGGWSSNINVPYGSDLVLTFTYELTIESGYEADEYGEVFVTVDGVVIPYQGNNYIQRLTGDGNGGATTTSGSQTVTLPLGTLIAGDHNIVIGAFNNERTAPDEFVTLFLDAAMIDIDCLADPIDSDGDGVFDEIDTCPGFDDNIDIDNDGIADGCDPCIGIPDVDEDGVCDDVDICISTYTLVDESFNNTSGIFTFVPGVITPAQGYETASDAAIGSTIILGGIDGEDITNMSAGYLTTVDVPYAGDIQLELAYELSIEAGYEPDEYGEIFVTVDGTIIPYQGNDFIQRLTGDGNGGATTASGPQLITISLGSLSVGEHDVVIGVFNNQKTVADEFTTFLLDQATIGISCPLTVIDSDGDGVFDQIDVCDGSDDNIDTDGDGIPDGCDPCTGIPDVDGDGVCDDVDLCIDNYNLITEEFDNTTGIFTFIPGVTTSAQGYEVTSNSPTGSTIVLGGIDDNTVTDISGGFGLTLPIPYAQDVQLEFLYELSIEEGYEPDEYGEVFVAVDGVVIAFEGNDYILRLTGDGNGGGITSSGSQSISLSLGTLTAGDHDIVIGVFNNKKTFNDEFVTFLLDQVSINIDCPDNPVDSDGDGIFDEVDQCPGFDDNIDVDADLIPDGCDPFVAEVIGESGSVSTNQNFTTVTLSRTYINPVVITGALTNNGGQAAVVRVDNVSANSFDVRVEEWECLDGNHSNEQISYMVVEAGTHELPNGIFLQAGNITAINHQWQVLTYPEAFGVEPIVLTQTTSTNEATAVNARVDHTQSNLTQTRIMLQEDEGSDDVHTNESLSWIAITPGASNGDLILEATNSTQTINQNFEFINFQRTYTNPLFIGKMSSNFGNQPASLRYRNLGTNQVELKVQEEQCGDNEIGHANEEIHYIILEGTPSIIAKSN